jgi:hypothetical protein
MKLLLDIIVTIFIVILIILGIAACSFPWNTSSKIKVGDCVVSGDYKLYKVIKVGDLGGYILQSNNPYSKPENWHSLKGGLTKTDCFDSFDFMGKK